jgi:hypothetical protein
VPHVRGCHPHPDDGRGFALAERARGQGTLPYRISAHTGARTYSLETESAATEFVKELDHMDPDWAEHLAES